jgi:hypothetical protein
LMQLKGRMMHTLFRILTASLALLAGLLAGCGGGGSTAAAPAASTTISGSAVKGPVGGATVRVTTLAGNVLGTTTTSPAGTYTLTINYGGDVVIEIQGGTYLDEATSQTVTLNQLKAIVSASGGSQTVHVTPLTYLAYFYSSNTAAGFNTALANLATQFGMSSTNLLTTLPNVNTGTTQAYGQVLRAMSQYVATQVGTTPTFNFEQLMGLLGTSSTLNSTTQAAFTAAFNTINPGQTLTFAFNGSGITIGGTGVGGGSGTCGVGVSGNITTMGITVPLNLNYCISGIAAGSCSSGNTSLNQTLSGQQGLVGGVNLNYTYSASCAAGAININLVP